MDIQSIVSNSSNYLGQNINNQVAPTQSVDNMDLEAIAQKAYDDEMARHQAEIAAAQAQYEEAKAALEQAQAAAANIASGNIQSIVSYDDNQLAQLQQQALAELLSQQDTTSPNATDSNVNNSANSTSVEPINTTISFESSGNAITGSISPGTNSTTFAAKSYNLDPASRQELIALVYSEAAENDYIASDSMGVASVVLNRLESGRHGSSISSVIHESNQFSGTHQSKYSRAMSDLSCVKPEMIAAVDRVLAGERNTAAQSFSGNGVRNSFR